jgi:hypothetical protein
MPAVVQHPAAGAQGLAAVVPAQAAVALVVPVGAVVVVEAAAAAAVNPLQVLALLPCR